jgi:parvulin-like peptidyl-prolyl isomerase
VTRPVALALVLALLSPLGCSRQDRPIITVGSQKVTVADYERSARGAQNQYAGPPDSAKVEFIRDLERRALMLEMAHRRGDDHTDVVRNTDRDNEQRALVQALYARLASASQPVSEAEARALYEARNVEAAVWLIYTSSEPSARAALARLKSGEPFQDVSRSFSLPGLLPPDGNLGWMLPGALPDPLDGALRTQKVGEVGGPYEAREGWFLLEVKERRPKPQGPFETQRAAMLDLMRQRKQRAAFNRAYLDMKRDYDEQAAPGGAQLVFRVMSAVDPLTPTEDQKRMPLATYRGGVYTLNDALLDLQRADAQRPPFSLLPAIEIWIESQVMTRVAVLEARKRHLNEEPEVARGLRAQRDQMLLNGVYQAAVVNVPAAGPELVRLAWERVRHQFTKLDQVKLAILDLADSAAMLRVYQQHEHTPHLADAVKQVDAALHVALVTVSYPTTDGTWTSLEPVLSQLQAGAWYGPVRSAGQWRLLEVLDKLTSEVKFEDLPQGVQQNIAGSAGDLARDQRFKEFTDSLAGALHPVRDQALIATLPWPVVPDVLGGR